MTVAAGAKSRVFRLASRVVLYGHAGPMVDGVAQANVGGLAHAHDAALAGSLGDGSHPRQASKRLVVSPLQGLERLGQQRGEDTPSDPGQRSEDRHIARLWRQPHTAPRSRSFTPSIRGPSNRVYHRGRSRRGLLQDWVAWPF